MKYTIKPTNQNRLIKDQKELFKSWIDTDFTNWDVTEKLTSRENHEVILNTQKTDFRLKDIFTDPEKMYLSQEEIISLIEQNSESLFPEKYKSIFFLTKSNDKFFVVRVLLDDVGLIVGVNELGSGLVYGGGRESRFVVSAESTQSSEKTLRDLAPLTLPSDRYTAFLEWCITDLEGITKVGRQKLLDKVKELLK